MASKTTNYGLNKHSPQDFYNVEARNENWDKIDEALAATDPTKITTKAAPADGDGVMIADSADGGKAKRLLWSNVKAALGKLFVPLARKINGKALSADVTLTGENIAVSTADPTAISSAVKYRVNPNLLDNWFFGRPVNQRGQVEYTEYLYTIDRWIFDNDSGTVTANLTQEGVRFSASSEATGIASLRQIIDPESINALAGKTVTLSCLGKADTSQQVLFFVDNQIATNASSVSVDGVCMTTCTYTFPTVMSSLAVFLYARSTSGAGEGSILAAKLELGSAQTLAHKENGVWVLNEIPDFGEQLRRCMYYAEKVESKDTPAITNSTFVPSGATSAVFILPYARKRTVPAIKFNDVSNYRSIARSISGETTAFSVTAISHLDVGRTKAAILVSFNATDQDYYCFLQRSDSAPAGYAFISADI